MNCGGPNRQKCFSSPNTPPSSDPPLTSDEYQDIPENKNVKHEVLLNIPGCKVYLMDEGEALELANGDFTPSRLSDENVSLATTIKVGEELQWPLTKDEPVVKLDASNYLFSLPMKDGKPLSYGVTFNRHKNLGYLDSFLKEHALFTAGSSSSTRKKELNWKEFAPTVDSYNSVLAKAIAGGTGQIVKGIFKCSNAYTNLVQKGGETMLIHVAEDKKVKASESKRTGNGATKKGALNKSLKRVRKLSKMTEKMSKAMLDVVGVATSSVMGPVARSGAGKAFLTMAPGEVILASLDAVDKIIDAAEAAEKQIMTASSGAVTRKVTNRFGEGAGEATQDVLATAGHVTGTAWNVFKIRKAINPASSISTGVMKNAVKKGRP